MEQFVLEDLWQFVLTQAIMATCQKSVAGCIGYWETNLEETHVVDGSDKSYANVKHWATQCIWCMYSVMFFLDTHLHSLGE